MLINPTEKLIYIGGEFILLDIITNKIETVDPLLCVSLEDVGRLKESFYNDMGKFM